MGSERPLRVNVIGRGPWGQNIVRTLKELGAEVPIVANRETGWQAAFEDEPDRICVAAHPSVNLPVVLECDKRGIPVWIEKPAALNLADVERMARCTVPVFVDYIYCYDTDFEGAWAHIINRMVEGKSHDFGWVYDWVPHVLSLCLQGQNRWQPGKTPLCAALDDFLNGHPYDWPMFGKTVDIHRIIDAAERMNACS